MDDDEARRESHRLDPDERRKESSTLMAAFFGGATMLHLLAAWAYVVAHRKEVLRSLLQFETAYEQLLQLHEKGELDTGNSKLSRDDLAHVQQLCELMRPGLHKNEVKKHAAEIEKLAGLLHQALTGQDALRGSS